MNKKAVRLLNRFAIVLDSSGSMASIARATVEVFNQQLAAIKDGAKREDQDATVTYTTFGESHAPVSEKFVDKPTHHLRELTLVDYRPDGNTPMFDAIGATLTSMVNLPRANDPECSFVMMVITDGDENASTKWKEDRLVARMRELQATDRWSFAFMLPANQLAGFRRRFPEIPEGNIRTWEATDRGAREMGAATGQAIRNYYNQRSSGATNTKDFFTTDLSKVTKAQVRNLDDLSGEAKIWGVGSECAIKDFIENHGQPFVIGRGYYQLTKKETVHASKNILIMEKGKKAVYGGPDARALLGLPAMGAMRVTPGNHANYDIFVQSTSSNRKLVRGTKFVYMTR